MKHSGRLTGIGAAIGMMLLILDSKTGLQGAQEGLELCLRTVIPALFPFFVLSSLLTGGFSGKELRFLRPLGKLLGIPAGAESVLLTGFLGGYPIGARSIADARRHGSLSPQDAARMMAFCNNAGPSFLFGIAASMFPHPWMGWALWGIHILSALAAALLFPGKSSGKTRMQTGHHPSVSEAVAASVRSMALVCGWVVIFRVLLAFLNRWCLWLFPEAVQVVLSGILELTNGCCALAKVENIGLRFVICSGLLAFGGLCVTMQTLSVANGVSIRYYFPGKLMQTIISIFLSLSLQTLLPPEEGLRIHPLLPLIPILFLFLLGIFHGKQQKGCSIPARLGV